MCREDRDGIEVLPVVLQGSRCLKKDTKSQCERENGKTPKGAVHLVSIRSDPNPRDPNFGYRAMSEAHELSKVGNLDRMTSSNVSTNTSLRFICETLPTLRPNK